MITCEQARENLIEYADNTLEHSEAGDVAAHLEQCPACRAELEAIRVLFDALHDSDPADPGDVYWQKFRRQVRDRIRDQEQPAARRGHRVAVAARAAMAAALLVAVFAGYRFFNSQTPVQPPATTKKPAVTAAVKAPLEHTHEERVLMATLDSVTIAPVASVSSEIDNRNSQPAPSVQTEPVPSIEPVQEFPFDIDDTAALVEEVDDTLYLFDDSLTREYIIPEVLDELTDQEAQAVLDSLEQGSSMFPAESPESVS